MAFKSLIKRPVIEPFVSIDGIEVDLDKIPDCSITPETYDRVRANTPGFRAIYQKLDDQALIQAVENNLKNCSHQFSDVVYEYALINHLVPELIKRLQSIHMISVPAGLSMSEF